MQRHCESNKVELNSWLHLRSQLTDPKRINEELTWYLNTKEHSDIAKAIKWKPIAEFI